MPDHSSPRRDVRPFAGAPTALVVLPTGDDEEVRGLRDLLVRERAELEVELGTDVVFGLAGQPGAPRPGHWNAPTVLVGPAEHNDELRAWQAQCGRGQGDEPYVELDGPVLVIDAPGGPSAVTSAVSLLRTAVRSPQRSSDRSAAPFRLVDAPATSPGEVVARLADEVSWTYPAFALRELDWAELEGRWRPVAEQSGAELSILQRWIAGLRDPHTAVRTTAARGFLPYTASIGLGADGRGVDSGRRGGGEPVIRLGHVPRWSAGWAAGARSGDVVTAVDGPLDPAHLLATTAAESRTAAWFAGRRALTVSPPGEVTVEVIDRTGRQLTWQETASGQPYPEPISWRRLPSGSGYLRIRGWLPGASWADALDAAFEDLAGCERLIVDVRGNVGGNLVTAVGFRDRFLAAPVTLGSIRFSVGDGTLAAPSPIEGTPFHGRRWTRPVRFLLDRLSYSATEDALLGLRDLEHVQFFGEPSGGGSGRPRSVRLQEGVALSVSSALTYENSGRCIEGQGLAVDVAVPQAALRCGDAVTVADSSW